MNSPLQSSLDILVIDDNELDRVAVERAVAAAGLRARIQTASDTESALDALSSQTFDCAFLDYLLPDGNGLEILTTARTSQVTTPFVVLTGSGNERVAIEMLRAGAVDYLTKSQITPDALAHCVRRAMRMQQIEAQARDAQKALLDSEERFRLLVEDVQDYAIVMLGEEGQLQSWNAGAERIFGYEEEEILNTPFDRFFTVDDQEMGIPEQELATARETGRADDERWHIRKDGSLFWASGVTTALRDKDGVLHGFSKIMRDLTERKQAEEALLANQTHIALLNQRLQTSMQETHHRVKNSLQLIAALVDMQALEGVDTIPVSELRQLGLHIHMLAMVHEVLMQQAARDGLAHYVGADTILERLLPLLQQMARGRRVVSQLDEARVTARQGSSLALVANELVSNAVRFGKNEIGVCLFVKDGIATLEVTDDGPGFPPRFDPERAKKAGLDLVQMLSQWDLGGKATYTNRPEGGAKVTVTMPLPHESTL